MDILLNILFPQKCLICHKGISIICSKCLLKINVSSIGYCVVCDRLSFQGLTHAKCLNSFTPLQCFSLYEYLGDVKTCVKSAKFKSKQFSVIAILVRHALNTSIELKTHISKNTLLLPIPLSNKKLSTRHFNQAEVISNVLSKYTGVATHPKILLRSIDTLPQYNKGRQARFLNIAGAFKIDPKYKPLLKTSKILLVDDICTTGATLIEASRVLYEAGALEVRCFTLSKRFIKL